MQLSTYLNFDGNGAEAMRFYADVFGSEAQIMLGKDAPDTMPGFEERLLHGAVLIANQTLMASDTMPGSALVKGDNFNLTVNVDEVGEQDRIFTALSAGGTIDEELQEAFFGRWGRLTDRFGIHWMVVLSKPMA